MSTDEIRTRVARCIRDYYAAHGEAPSIRRIIDDAHVNRQRFYDAFPGIAAACRLAGVPVPDARIHQAAPANAALRNRRITPPRRVAAVAGGPPIHERLSTLQALLGVPGPADAIDMAIDTIRAITRHPLYPQVGDPRRLLDQLETTYQQGRETLLDKLDEFREDNDALQDALSRFLDAFGDTFFDSEGYDAMRTFMASRGYRGSFANMLRDCVEMAMESKGACYRNGAFHAINEGPATPPLVWRA